MSSQVKIFLIVLIIMFFPAVFAQAGPPSYGAFQDIQGEIAKLMQENQLLKTQYDALSQEYEQLRAKYEQENREAERLNSLAKRRIDSESNSQASVGGLEREVERIQGDIMLKETKSRYMEGETIDMQERQKLWELKIADLEYEKQQVELEYKRKELMIHGKKNQQDSTAVELKQALTSKLQEEEAIRAKMKAMHQYGGNSAGYLQQLREENESLRREIEKRRKARELKPDQVSLQSSANSKTQDARQASGMTKEGHAKLQAEVNALEKEYVNYNNSMEASIAAQGKRKEMMQKVISMDQRNQELREKIAELKQGMNILGQ